MLGKPMGWSSSCHRAPRLEQAPRRVFDDTNNRDSSMSGCRLSRASEDATCPTVAPRLRRIGAATNPKRPQN